MNIFDRIHRLPVFLTGLTHLPAIPIVLDDLPDTLIKLEGRKLQVTQAKQALSNTYTIDGVTTTGYNFMFSPITEAQNQQLSEDLINTTQNNVTAALAALHTMAFKKEHDASLDVPTEGPSALSLTDPSQFAMSWTTFDGVYDDGQPFLKDWAASLTDVTAATNSFWPTIAQYGLGYNLLIIEKLRSERLDEVREKFAHIWNDELENLNQSGLIYLIDMTMFQSTQPQLVRGSDRFTPSTYTLLKQDKDTKAIVPVAITVSGYQGSGSQTYVYGQTSDSSWLYALQAAKVSISVYGVWVGHVCHWHLPTAALQMTMYNSLPTSHSLYALLAPQSDYLMAFNDALLLLWSSIAPPTSFTTGYHFLEFADLHFQNRTFFDDDPLQTLDRLGIAPDDFTSASGEAWDLYPIVQHYLTVWNAVSDYVTRCVNALYTSDSSVQSDESLQKWITASQSADDGNITSLPNVQDKQSLIKFLSSLVYRITMHGCSRLNSTANPALTFVGNYPHCLQRTDIVSPAANLSTQELLSYLPKTGTIGEAINFYYIFVFSTPYVSFLPISGDGDELPFTGGTANACNRALIALRGVIRQLTATLYHQKNPEYFQWPLSIET